MTDRNDLVRGMLTREWQSMDDIARRCYEKGLYPNMRYARGGVRKLYTKLEKYGLAERMNVKRKCGGRGYSVLWRLTS